MTAEEGLENPQPTEPQLRLSDETIENLIKAFEERVPFRPGMTLVQLAASLEGKKILAESGILLGFGDPFSYHDNGVLVMGGAKVGKSSLVTRFHNENPDAVKRLAGQDDILLIGNPAQLEFKAQDYQIGTMHRTYGNDYAEIFKKLQQDVVQLPHAPLKAIVYLSQPQRYAQSETVEEAISSNLLGLEPKPADFTGVQILKYNMPLDINEEVMQKVYTDSKTKLDAALKIPQ